MALGLGSSASTYEKPTAASRGHPQAQSLLARTGARREDLVGTVRSLTFRARKPLAERRAR